MSVVEFFNGKNVFITGATGFMGKVLVEKLLWSCKGIGDIYILMRNKKGANLDDRLNALVKLPVFDRIRENDPELISKIKPINGDIYEKNLGLSEEDSAILEERVSVIFHVAASVRFDDSLKKAILLNVRATRDVMELAKRTKNLKVLSYVSTCYSNCDNSIIKEEIYDANYDWKLMIDLAETADEHLLNVLQPKILDKKPNTYTFSKQLAEMVVKEYSVDFPCVIYRPSIVTYSLIDPVPGWIDSLNGPGGLCLGFLTGVMHVLLYNSQYVPDFVPCDYSIRGLIVATWYTSKSSIMECQVYNSASGDRREDKPDFIKNCFKFDFVYQLPVRTALWYPVLIETSSQSLFLFMTIIIHLIPGLLVDFILKIKNIDFSLMRIYRKAFVANNSLSYFMFNSWNIHVAKYYSLLDSLSEDDRKAFNFDVLEIDFLHGFYIGLLGTKRFLLHEDTSDSAVKEDKKKFKRLYYAHQILLLIFIGFIIYVFYKIIDHYVSS